MVGLLGPGSAGKNYLVLHDCRPDLSGFRQSVAGRQRHDTAGDVSAGPARHQLSSPGSLGVRKLTVEDNLLAILETLPLNRRERHTRMDRLITQLGLEQVRHSKGYVLSGGERRRTEIARSLVIEPSFLLLDEPFSGIDPIQVLELQKIIFDLKNSGIGILVTDHNVRETLAVTDRAYIINNGRIFRSGTPDQLGNDVEVRRVYLGENFNLGLPSGR